MGQRALVTMAPQAWKSHIEKATGLQVSRPSKVRVLSYRLVSPSDVSIKQTLP